MYTFGQWLHLQSYIHYKLHMYTLLYTIHLQYIKKYIHIYTYYHVHNKMSLYASDFIIFGFCLTKKSQYNNNKVKNILLTFIPSVPLCYFYTHVYSKNLMMPVFDKWKKEKSDHSYVLFIFLHRLMQIFLIFRMAKGDYFAWTIPRDCVLF